MRILIVEGEPCYGGQARHVYDLATGMFNHGHDVSVACRHPQLLNALHSAQVPCHQLPFYTGFDVVSMRSLYRLIKDNRYDIVHTHGVRAGVLGRLAARIGGRSKVVHTVYTLAPDLAQGPGLIQPLRRSMYSYSEMKLSQMTDRIITVSEDLKRRCIKGGIAYDRLVTIHSGVDLSHYECLNSKAHARGKIGIPSGCRLIGTVARFTPRKNLKDFISAAKIISKRFDDAMFVLIGDGPDAAKLKEQACLEGISHRTVFTGARKDVAGILPGFDVFVMTSICEGHPLALLEAMAAGLPTVATSVTGINETVVEDVTGYTVEPGDVDELAERICGLLSEPKLAAAMGESARNRVNECFGLEQMIKETEKLYTDLAEHKVYTRIAEAF